MSGGRFIGIICGLKSEAHGTSAAAPAGKVRIGVSGASAKRAEELAEKFCRDGAAALISVGVSGGLDPTLKPGDLVIGDKVVGDDGGHYEADGYLLGAIRVEAAALGAVSGPIFGSNAIIENKEKKSVLFANHSCLAVDMESHGAARAAMRAGVPFLAIRAIADPADRALPSAALNAVAPDGSTRVWATLAAALRDPKQFPELMKLGADSSAALKTLRRSLGPLFGRLFLALDL